MKIQKQRILNWMVILTVIFTVCLSVHYSIAVPGGGAVTFIDNESNNGSDAGERQDPGGVIIWMNLNTVQQNVDWKGYVGNVTGTLTLDDASNNTIYNWGTDDVTGEVYATRNDSVDFSNINCTNVSTNLPNENSWYDFAQSENDSLNSTFNWTTHSAFSVGTESLNANDCLSLYTFVSDASQADATTSDFQEVLIADNNSVYIYVAILETQQTGFNNANYDFQIILPENGTDPVPTTYYFYVELG